MNYSTTSNFSTKIICMFFICLGLSFSLSAQNDSTIKDAQIHIEKNLKKFNLEKNDVSELRIVNEIHDKKTNITHLYLQQQKNGIDVLGGTIGVHFKNDKVAHFTSKFEPNISRRIKSNAIAVSASEALDNATQSINMYINSVPAIFQPSTGAEKATIFSKGNISEKEIPLKLVYVKNNSGELVLSWQVEIYELGQQHYWMIYIDATTGEMISKTDLVISCDFGGKHLITDSPNEIKHQHAHKHEYGNKNCSSEIAEPGVPKSKMNLEDLVFLGAHSYRVLQEPIEAPNDPNNTNTSGLLEDISTAGHAIASPYGWHSIDGSSESPITVGNNVNATNDPGTESPVTVPPQVKHAATATNTPPTAPFEFHYDTDLTQGPETYADAAIVNLFYWNNIIHDIFYQYGFTEVNGNFQTTNVFNGTDRGGLGQDAVIAEAQDGEALNNANMLTLPDGTPPRMQMYLWSSTTSSDLVFFNTINGASSNKKYIGIEAAFGTGNELDAAGVTGDIVLIDANSMAPGSDDEGCGTGQGVGLPPDNLSLLTGNIVLIKRGSCAFAEKVSSAQLAGASAVIIYNNVPTEGPISMGGGETGNSVTIPCVSISLEDGKDLLLEMEQGTVNLTLKSLTPNLLVDGDYDNGIIAHEYGHGISNRLTGGPNAVGPLGGDEQQGEGWSDFFALYLSTQTNDLAPPTIEHPNGVLPNHGIGTYVFKQNFNTGGGIRPAPYSGDLAVNNYTYKDVGKGEEISIPHGVGFIWCTILYEMMQNIIDMVPLNNDLYQDGISAGAGGNNIALQLVMQGLQLQPTSPTFVESRDAILSADTLLYGGAYSCAIWEAFAKRGVGFFASDGGTNGVGDEIENFELSPGCSSTVGGVAKLEIKKTSIGKVDNGEQITFDITVTNTSLGFPASDVVITDNLPSNMYFVSATDGGTHSGGVITFPTIPTLAAGASVTVSVTATVFVSGNATTLHFEDNIENGANNWTTIGDWTVSNDDPKSGSNVWFCSDAMQPSNNTLTLANSLEITANTQLSFYHKHALESGFDGGVVELSTDGIVWTDIGSLMTQNGYNDNIPAGNNPLLIGAAFSGTTDGYIETRADLSSYSGQSVMVRFRLATDIGTNIAGWWIDDVRLYDNPTSEINVTNFTALNNLSGSATADVLVLTSSCTGIETYYPDADDDGNGDITAEGTQFCIGSNPSGFSTDNTDCNDNNPNDDILDLVNPIDFGHYYAGTTLTATGTVSVPSNNESVELQSGYEIILTPGFIATTGTDFHAYIDPDCPFSPPMELQQDLDDHVEIMTKNDSKQFFEDEVIVEDALKIFPNPTRNETTIEFTIGEESLINIAVFDAQGSMIDNLFTNKNTSAGKSTILYSTSKLSSGVYMVVLKTERKNTVQRLVVIKN